MFIDVLAATHCHLLQKIQIGFTFLVPAHPGSPGQRAVKRMHACVLLLLLGQLTYQLCTNLFVFCHQQYLKIDPLS